MIPIHRRTQFDVTRRSCRVGDGSIYVYGSIGDRTVASVSRAMKRVERFDGDEWQTSETRAYTYDAFGRTISQSGPLADVFRHRFSTKYFDLETGLYYYGYRFYLPVLRCWLTRDPIEERGGLNLYCMCENSLVFSFDVWGTDRYMTTFSANPTNDQWHVGVAVDTWKCSNGSWVKTGVATFDFGVDDSSFWNRLGTYFRE